MATTLLAAEQELSKQIGDYWSSTTTSDGAADGTTLVDTALKAPANDWITDESWSFLIEEPAEAGTSIYEERKVSSLANSTGTLTVLAHGDKVESGIDYEVHRLFSPSEKRRALVAAARNVYPALFTEIWNEELVSGNWLKDGSFERWTTATNLTDWAETTLTATQTSATNKFKHGAYSAKLSTAAGNLKQRINEFEDLKGLQGKQVTFTIQAWCDTASCLRIAIYDGTTRTYSGYRTGDSTWTQDNPRNNSMYVSAFIGYNPTEITFEIYHDVAAGVSYVDDARAISTPRGRLYIGHLGLYRNEPHKIEIEPEYYSHDEPWTTVRDCKVDKDGYIYLPTSYLSDRRLRVRGIGILDFLVSGASSTAWTATIAVDQPQLDILVAQAAVYLYTWVSMPNYESGTREAYQGALGFWAEELKRRKNQFRMKSPPATVNWGLD